MSGSTPRHHQLRFAILFSALMFVVGGDHDAGAQNVTITPQVATTVAGQPYVSMQPSQPGKLVASLPIDKQKVKGFTVSVSVDQLTGTGYLPVEITVKSTSVFSADRNLSFRLEPVELSQSPPQSGIAVDIPINVTQGSKQVQSIHHIPKWTVGSHYELRVFEDGGELKEYASEIGQLISRSYRAPTNTLMHESGMNWLSINDRGVSNELTQSAIRGQGLKAGNPQRTISFNQRSWANAPINTVAVAAIGNVPADWRHFQAYDAILISKADLQNVAQQHADLFAAIRDWVLGGGTLIAIGVESMAETCELMNFSVQSAYSDDDLLKTLSRTASTHVGLIQQQLNNQKTYMQAIANGAVIANAGVNINVGKAEALEQVKSIDSEIQRLRQPSAQHSAANPRIWSQRVAAGRVIGLKSDPTMYDWKMVGDMFGFRRSPTLRRGVDPIVGDQRARRWMIPGVAQPPVYTFMGLLGLFVVLVGPIAYRRTTKAGRGYLMFAIAPALALTTTLAMLTYGVVSDGFGTTARIRQLTWVDGHSGDGFDRTRATYFAGVRPSAGLRFAGDAEVLEYPNYNGQSWEDLNRKSFNLKGNVRLDKDSQVFDSSFLPSRDQRQFIVHQPRRQIGRLSIQRPAGADPLLSPTLDSSFDFPLHNVVICDATGLYWSVPRISAKESGVTCTRLLKTDGSKRLGDLYNAHRPIAATGERNSSGSYNSYQVRDIIVSLNRSVSGSNKLITDGIFEDWMQQKLQVDGDLPRNSFVAEGTVSADVVAVEGAEVVESVRYLFGSLP